MREQGHKEIIRKVKKIEIQTKNMVDGLLQGAYHSVFRGRGIEFSEVRDYVIGDDIRSIDWNVTARMNEPYVKEFIEERDLTVYLIFDVSASSRFGSIREKRGLAIELCASLMFAVLKNNDNVGLCLFSEGVEKYMPARKGRKHVLRLIRELLVYEPHTKGTDLAATLVFVSKVMKKRAIIFIISDFYTGRILTPLRILTRRHDIILLKILDPREMDIPDVGYIQLEDEESGEQILINTSDPVFRKEYRKLAEKKQQHFEKKMRSLRIDTIRLSTEHSFQAPLRKYFEMRKRRR